MKRALLTCLLALVMGLVLKTNAQSLGFSNLKITKVLDVQTPSSKRTDTKKFVVNMEFDLRYGANDKIVNVHFFKDEDYIEPQQSKKFFDCNNPKPSGIPKIAQLGKDIDQPGKSMLDLVIDNSIPRGATGALVDVTLLDHYVNDERVGVTSSIDFSSIKVSKTYTGFNNTDHFIISNLVIYINEYTSSTFPFKVIVWSSNGNANNVVNVVCDQRYFLNDPMISGSIVCGTPRMFSFTAQFMEPIPQDVKYEAILDLNGNGAIDADEPIVSSAPISGDISSKTYTSPLLGISEYYAIGNEYAGKKLMIIIKGGSYVTGEIPQMLDIEPCSVLPVDFKSFYAYRNKQKKEQILLKWEVATEQNNKGFYVQRKTTGEWQSIAFVPTKAPGGNSNTTINYGYADYNTTKNVTQYRLLQVDIDNKSSFSEVRSILGADESASVLVYPNPSLTGNVNLVFSSQNSIKEVVVSDLTGRVVKYYTQVSNNNLSIEGLKSGIYTIKIIDRSTAVSSVEKVIIK